MVKRDKSEQEIKMFDLFNTAIKLVRSLRNVSVVTHAQFHIGRESLARENKAGGIWRQEVHIVHVIIWDFVLFLVVII